MLFLLILFLDLRQTIIMKRTILKVGTLATLSVLITVTGCQKDTMSPKPHAKTPAGTEKQVPPDNEKMLIVPTVEEFEDLISRADDQLLTDLENLSYESYSESDQDKEKVGDAFLSAALNSDMIIQIGHYLYRINKATEHVYTLPVSEIASYQDLVTEDLSNKYVLEYSTVDNVFELLGEAIDEEKGSKKCASSNSSVDDWYEYANFIDAGNIYGNGTDKRYKFERRFMVKYDNWGIYRKLFTEFKHNEKWFGIFDETYFSVVYNGNYQVKNGGSGSFNYIPAYTFAANSNYTGTTQYEYLDDSKEFVHYKGTKCLSGFYLKGWVWMRGREHLKPILVPSSGYRQISGN